MKLTESRSAGMCAALPLISVDGDPGMWADVGRRQVGFGYPPTVRFAPIAILVLVVGAFILTLTKGGGAVFLAAAVVALAIALVLRRRVELSGDTIAIVELLTARRFQRDEIAGVSWEPGSRVVLELKSGGQVSLPSLSSHPADISNAIHSWLQEGYLSEGAVQQ